MRKEKIYKNKIDLINKVVTEDDVVLDVGFWGQGVRAEEEHWPHKKLIELADTVDGLDLEFDIDLLKKINPRGEYLASSAENFSMLRGQKYTKIIAADIIEHLPNPGLFLDCCKNHLVPGGQIIITTPNAFNLFVLAGKLMHVEPPTNDDHTCYFNSRTLKKLLTKVGWEAEEVGYLYTLGVLHKESYKKKILNIMYSVLNRFTSKYLETLVVIATPKMKN